MVNMQSLQRLLAPLKHRIRLLVSRDVITRIDDSKPTQCLQVKSFAKPQDGVENMQTYGFATHPLPGAEAVGVCIGGHRDQCLVISTPDSRYRLKLEAGEVAIYSDEGDVVRLGRGRQIEVIGGARVTIMSPEVVLSADSVSISGSLDVAGGISSQGQVSDSSGSMSAMRSTYNAHTQPVSAGVAGIPTEQM